MKRMAIALSTIGLSLILTGCYKQAEETMKAGNDIVVEKLFEHNGCTMYRFKDAEMVYWSDCRGGTQYEVTRSNGKVTTKKRHMEITNDR
ncbi:hypothetical protein CPT_MyoSmar_015 [Serratia phage MyoSmar]|uniref:DUF4884 domain-containing protein n=1 Tax=Serratia phage MyoSmar TaxID=2596673 RepID=A0A5B9N622_9CAUD|nr:hypothetical protein HWC56_gp015 [Serratia phage MyoSmar]QEG09464.1 hypothetical protein CPT_MyoSmar_015 [Serratia phage MyoSmar]